MEKKRKSRSAEKSPRCDLMAPIPIGDQHCDLSNGSSAPPHPELEPIFQEKPEQH
jgi:hypothetical protein